jgi:hypothetical protein
VQGDYKLLGGREQSREYLSSVSLVLNKKLAIEKQEEAF